MLHHVYIIFAGDAIYIGRTKDLIGRMQNHGMLWCDWAVLESVDSMQIREREAYWVKHFLDAGCTVLNSDRGCKIPGLLGHSEECRRKISLALKGRPFTEERKAALKKARALRGAYPPETRKKMSEAWFRKSAEYRNQRAVAAAQARWGG